MDYQYQLQLYMALLSPETFGKPTEHHHGYSTKLAQLIGMQRPGIRNLTTAPNTCHDHRYEEP